MNKNYSDVLGKSVFLKIFNRISLVLILGVALIVQAAPGDLDTTFAGTGKSRVGFGFGDGKGYAVAVQTDGKTVVAGSSQNGTHDVFSVVRYNTDGSLDASFGVGGKVQTPVGSSSSGAYAVRIQTDGKIVVAGYQLDSDFDFAVVRYNANGSLDTSFGGDGIVTTPIGTNSDEQGYALIIQSDGKLIVAGYSGILTGFDFAIVRYNTNGLLDTTFDGDGKVITDFGDNDAAFAVTIQPDGKIVAAGNSGTPTPSSQQVAVARYNTNGSPDTTFDSDGKVLTSSSEGGVSGLAVAIQLGTATTPDKIVVAGHTNAIQVVNDKIAVYRYNLNGSLDTTFDGDGEVITDHPNISSGANDLRIQGIGNQPRKIIVVAASAGNAIAVVRYNSDGSPDTSFDSDGIAFASFGTPTVGSALAFAAGKIVVAGYSRISLNKNDFAIARFNTDGSLDTTFDEDGKRTDDVGDLEAVAKSAAIQTDGKIVVAGYALRNPDGTNKDFAVARYNADGSLDNSFDTDGRVTTAIGTSDDQANAVAIQADGKIVAAGSRFNGTASNFAIVRYNSDGSPDTSFDADGIVIHAIGTNSIANAIAIQSDGKIVVAGSSNDDFAVVRYLANGSPDSSFGSNNNGIVITVIGSEGIATAVKVQSDGKIVVAGSAFIANQDFAVVRYLANGTPDPNFGSLGKVTTDIGNSTDVGFGMAIQSDGKIVVAGDSFNGADFDFAVARYNPNGSPDNSFDADGKTTTAVGTGNDNGNALAIQTDGKILVAGSTRSDFAVARYNPNGSLDTSYGSFGKVVVGFSIGSNDFGNAMALDSSGRAVVAGEADELFGIVRLLGDPSLAPSFEADVAARPNGDGLILSDDVVQIRRFLNGTHTADQTTNEFQRADSSPFAARGDGRILSDDVVQSRRYQNGTNPRQPVGGPMTQSAAHPSDTVDNLVGEVSKTVVDNADNGVNGELRVESATASAGQPVTVNVRVDAQGDESEYGFVLSYDQTKLSMPIIGAGNDGASVRSCNTATAGQINCSVGGFPINNPSSSDTGIGEIGSGTNQILITVTFTTAANAPSGDTPLTLSNANASSDAPQLFTPATTNGMVTILARTATTISVSGRVLTPTSRGLINATVLLTDSFGNRRTARTSTFGYYRFETVEAGQTSIFEVRSKRYRFAPQVVTVTEDLEDLNFTAFP